ncbi:MAG: hypothetical protein ISR65_09305 [Bacteriovoracaceae bacterium]|nr:hypothetical protein [Bacteriovoracaceae bacterium]
MKKIVRMLSILFLLSACDMGSNLSPRTDVQEYLNSGDDIGLGQSRVILDNPIILTGKASLSRTYNLSRLLSVDPYDITKGQFLEGGCAILPSQRVCIENPSDTNCTYASINRECFSILQNEYATKISSVGGRWTYEPSTTEFWQVNTYYHMDRVVSKFVNNMNDLYLMAQPTAPAGMNYKTAIPATLISGEKNWWSDSDKNLRVFSHCDAKDNAYFSPSKFALCFGYDSQYSNMWWVQDPSVIYHEVGHAIIQTMLNLRNVASNLAQDNRVDLGTLFYDEAHAIGEGVSDYFSYFVNGRTHFGEWALGRFNSLSRPMSEDDPIHATGISTAPDARLSYPRYVNYDANDPTSNTEDVHAAGQIVSHYLVALTMDLESTCNFSTDSTTNHNLAVTYVVNLLAETFAELGDLTAKGSDYTAAGEYPVNLNEVHAREWILKVNQITYRNFFQKFAKYLFLVFNQGSRCNGTSYPIDNIEKLLDQYGLLLFKSYNENGNDKTTGHTGTSTPVLTANRLHTVLVSKDFIQLAQGASTSEIYIFDNRKNMKEALGSLIRDGVITGISPQIENDLPYNNGNSQISPGEFIGISLNLYNSSNTTLGGVQVLANDWDHFKNGMPCNTFADQFPLDSAGAANVAGESVPSLTPGDCNYIAQNNGLSETGDVNDVKDPLYPICMVQVNEANSTRWASQEVFREKIMLEKMNCLGGLNPDGTKDTKSCFIRAIPGADHSFFSKIEPLKTWGETLATSTGAPDFHHSNLIFFEVSPWIPPGTTFNCRFRVRFSNCSDCYSDPADTDDYLDYEYSGPKPFKILHHQFIVID